MDHSQFGVHSGDPEWDSRVEHAASADVRQLLRNARRRRRERWLVGAIVLVAIALVGVLLLRIGLFDADPPAAAPAGDGGPAETVTLVLDLGHPFAKSPAADWADGAAGIVPPPATAIGAFTTEQVATALAQVRDVLIASRLDRRLVVGHDAEPYLGALAQDARRQLEPLFGGGREAEVQSLVSLVADGARLLPAEPKVNGRMSVEQGRKGELIVHTNYVFVYAFHTDAPDKIVDLMDILVVVRAEVDYVLLTGDRWTSGSQGWWYGDTAGFAYSIACDAYRKGFLAPAVTEGTATDVSGVDRGRYFDPDSPLPAASGCAR